MRNLTATICLTIAVLLGSVGVSWGYTLKGIGADKCGEILSDSDNGKKGNFYYMRISWIHGYITAKNSASGAFKGKGVSADSIYYSIIKYCRENPLKDLDDASRHIYKYVLP